MRLNLAFIGIGCALGLGLFAQEWHPNESLEAFAERIGQPTQTNLKIDEQASISFNLIPATTFSMGRNPPEKPGLISFIGHFVLIALVLILVFLSPRWLAFFSHQGRMQFNLKHMLFCVLYIAGLFYVWFEFQNCRAVWAQYVMLKDAFQKDEAPQRWVKIEQPFLLSQYEVTQAQFEAVMKFNPSHFRGMDRPVECVSWDDAQEFCKRLSQRTERIIRLPSEAEWAFACRGQSYKVAAEFVTAGLDDFGWFYSNSEAQTQPVGKKLPNLLGLFDMQGNVREWVEDDWHWTYDGAPSTANAWVDSPRNHAKRVCRGGAWSYHREYARTTARAFENAETKDPNIGFRVVLELPKLKR